MDTAIVLVPSPALEVQGSARIVHLPMSPVVMEWEDRRSARPQAWVGFNSGAASL